MGKLIATEYVTLDGVMEAPGGETSLGELGGWSFRGWNEEAAKFKFDELFASDALLLGRVTYQIFADAWPKRKDERGFADRMNSLPKYVVSSTLPSLEWNNSQRLVGDPVQEVARLKHTAGQNILLFGSADLVNTLLQADLIDELRLMVFPMVLGAGKRLFSAGKNLAFALAETKTFSTGVVVLTYRPEK